MAIFAGQGRGYGRTPPFPGTATELCINLNQTKNKIRGEITSVSHICLNPLVPAVFLFSCMCYNLTPTVPHKIQHNVVNF